MHADLANIDIRLCHEDDLIAIATIESSQGFTAWSAKQLEESFRQHHFYTLQHQKKIIGYSIFHALIDEIELLNIVIDKSYRLQGLAEYLLLRCLSVFNEQQQFNACLLEVGEKNPSAIALYKKLGFQKIGLRKNYYRKQTPYQDALIFRLSL